MRGRHWRVGVDEAGRLDKFLAAADRLGSRSRAADAIDRGKVYVNGEEAASVDAARMLVSGDDVRLWMDRPGSGRTVRPRRRRAGDLVVAYEDDALLVVDKPPGLLTVPLGRAADRSTLVAHVEAYLRSRGRRRPQIVHRIDRDTSGLVVFAKDAATLADLKRQFLERSPERLYLAVVHGHPSPAEGRWRDHLTWDGEALIQRPTAAASARSKEAISDYRVRQLLRGAALIEVRLTTGKRNQIRVQAAMHGHPLIGERIYDAPTGETIAFPRQALHAWRLAFRHPQTGRQIECTSPLPADIAALIARLTSRPPA